MIFKALENEKHWHAAYFSTFDKIGITSKDKSHFHVLQPMEDGSLVVMPATEYKDEHTHELEEIDLEVKPDKEPTEEDDLQISADLYEKALEIEADSIDEAEEDEDFYSGDQWDDSVVAKLNSEQRAHLVINEIKPKIDALIGHQAQNRTDIKLMPVESGDQIAADIYNYRIKNICTFNNYDHEETQSFEDMLITGRGVIVVDIDTSNNITGNVTVESIDWRDAFFGEHKKLDGRDLLYAGIRRWKTPAEVSELYPDKAEDISVDVSLVFDKDPVPRDKRDYYTRQPGGSLLLGSTITKKNNKMLDMTDKKYQLIEVQRKIFKQTPVIMRPKDNFYKNVISVDKALVKKLKSIEILRDVTSLSYKIRKVIFAGNVMLHREDSPFKDISIVPVIGNKKKNICWGKVKEVKDPQRELNKRHSQSIDIINMMAAYNIGITSEAFETDADYNDWLRNRMVPGFVPRFAPGAFNGQVHEFNGVKYPSEVVAMSELNSVKIAKIMNVSEEMLGISGGNQSGVALAQKLRMGLVGNERYFDHLSLSKRRVGKLIVQAIQLIDSPEKLMRIVENYNGDMKVEVGGSELYPQIGIEEQISLAMQTGELDQETAQGVMEILQGGGELPQDVQQLLQSMQQIADEQKRASYLSILENEDLTTYDVVVAESQYSPTMMFTNFLLLKELAASGVAIPPSELVDLMPNLTRDRKERIIGAIEQSAQAMAQAEDKKSETEIRKTMIAKGDA